MIPLPLYIFILLQLILVSYIDIKHRKISNKWIILNLLIAVILFIIFPAIYPFKLEVFQFSFAFILIGFVLFYLKIMGGGDSKYLASFFLITPFDQQDVVLYYLLLSTIFVGMLFFTNNIVAKRKQLAAAIREKDIQGVKSCFGTKFAFAPVILLTWILFGLDLLEKTS